MKMELPRTQYSQEFRKESVKFFIESGLTLVEAAKRLSLPKRTLKNWVNADKRGELVAVGKHQKPLTELELELSRVKRELAEVKMERDFIKKCCFHPLNLQRRISRRGRSEIRSD
jgi:transposase